MVASWLGAAERFVGTGSGSELDRLGLLIDMYCQFDEERFLPLVDAAIRAIEATGIDGTEAQKCTEVLEQIVMSLLPMSMQRDAQQVVSSATAKMLRDYGDSLTLEEIRSVSDTLSESGADQAEAGDATRAALQAYIGQMRQTVDELSSLSELEDYEKELTALMADYGLHDAHVANRIHRRREELNNEEGRGEGYSGRGVGLRGHISNDEIRSMFDGLRRL